MPGTFTTAHHWPQVPVHDDAVAFYRDVLDRSSVANVDECACATESGCADERATREPIVRDEGVGDVVFDEAMERATPDAVDATTARYVRALRREHAAADETFRVHPAFRAVCRDGPGRTTPLEDGSFATRRFLAGTADEGALSTPEPGLVRDGRRPASTLTPCPVSVQNWTRDEKKC